MAKAINRKITIEFRLKFGWLAARKTQEAPKNSLDGWGNFRSKAAENPLINHVRSQTQRGEIMRCDP